VSRPQSLLRGNVPVLLLVPVALTAFRADVVDRGAFDRAERAMVTVEAEEPR
jgi:hypothetical protein